LCDAYIPLNGSILRREFCLGVYIGCKHQTQKVAAGFCHQAAGSLRATPGQDGLQGILTAGGAIAEAGIEAQPNARQRAL
jgi:hypothetical protein